MTTWNYIWNFAVMFLSLVNMHRAVRIKDKDKATWLVGVALWQLGLVIIGVLMEVVDRLQTIVDMMG